MKCVLFADTSSACNTATFSGCAGLGPSTYIQNCCQGSCANGYEACYFCPEGQVGGSHCFNLDSSLEAQCLSDSGCESTGSTGMVYILVHILVWKFNLYAICYM